jgi:trehalose 6-phosphate synthase/phosphatase
MNLIAKEYVASHVDEKGVLILSETAGASLELGEATIVNLNDTEQVASAINEALLLPEKEQSRRIRIMQKRLRRYDVFRWAKDFTDRLKETTELREVRSHKKLNPDIMIELVDRYRSSKRRLLLLDYDGTLAPIERTPDKAKPSNRVIRLLKQLAAVPKNTVVVISGRDRDNLENWLGMLPIDLIAEHGTWVRRRTSKKWRTLERQTSHEWKEKVRDVLEVFVDRTPGALIEEKCSGLAWHYRMTDPDMGALRARELVEELKELLANMPLQVITGSKVIEVRCGNIDKGKAALEWISDGYDFVLAIGDDETDEDLFDVIPQDSWSIKVGAGDTTKARFSVDSTDDAVCLLEVLTR